MTCACGEQNDSGCGEGQTPCFTFDRLVISVEQFPESHMWSTMCPRFLEPHVSIPLMVDHWDDSPDDLVWNCDEFQGVYCETELDKMVYLHVSTVLGPPVL